ncbi:adenosine deaminase [Salinihabitans flavidus]|nr:adenosine deaminase [Salinihabitans flavidus]
MADLAKVELHLHHEGAAPPDLIRQLAFEKKVDLSRAFAPDGGYAFRGFARFLEVYEAVASVLRTPEDYSRLTAAILERSAQDGIVYCESFLSPDFCGGGDVGAWREYLQAIREAAERAERAHGILLRGIACCVRHFGPQRARRAALCAAETAGDWIVGFGMVGDETMGTQGDFAWSFDLAREAGLQRTTHAGEFAGPESVRQALDDLDVARIGHGVRAIEDPALVARLAERGTVLEVCPGSNIALGIYPDMAAHPIARLREAGVKLTVSTDDPPFFHTTLSREYERLRHAFGWDEAVFADLNRIAAEAAFCNDATRARVLKRLEST